MKNENNFIHVVIADDHALTRIGIRSLIETDPGIVIVGETDNGAEAQTMVARLHPDILLLDLRMPGFQPYQVDRWVRENCPQTSVLILTAHDRDCYLAKAIAGGAAGFLAKDDPALRLVEALHRAARGERLFTRQQRQRAHSWQREVGARLHSLTRREQQVLARLADGLSNPAIAEELSVSVRTVETHVTHILRTLNLASRGEAIAWAHTHLPELQGINP